MAEPRLLVEILEDYDSPEWRESLERDYQIFAKRYQRDLRSYGHEKTVKAALAILRDLWFQEYRENE